MPLYFAYGSNLSIGQMKQRCPSSRPLGRAHLRGWHLTFPRRSSRWGGGVAGIVPSASAATEGVDGAVYELDEADLQRLDGFEGVAQNHYQRIGLTVELADGRPLDCWTYLATPEPGAPFTPKRPYIETMLRGTRDHALPHALQQRLAAWL